MKKLFLALGTVAAVVAPVVSVVSCGSEEDNKLALTKVKFKAFKHYAQMTDEQKSDLNKTLKDMTQEDMDKAMGVTTVA